LEAATVEVRRWNVAASGSSQRCERFELVDFERLRSEHLRHDFLTSTQLVDMFHLAFIPTAARVRRDNIGRYD
jgi:hypothetical protein